MKKLDRNVDIFGIPVFSGSRLEALEWIEKKLIENQEKRPVVVLTPTTEQVVMAQKDEKLWQAFFASDINLPDSVGLKFASGGKIRERVTGVDAATRLVATAARQGKKVFLLGGKGETAWVAAKELERKYEGLVIKGAEGFNDIKSQFQISNDKSNLNVKFQNDQTEKVIREINEWGADLLLVAFGAPWQERWVIEHRNKLKVKVVMVVGGALDMWAKNVPRAPLGMRKIGLEWLWRLVLEPWRIKRQLRLVEFVGMVIKAKKR